MGPVRRGYNAASQVRALESHCGASRFVFNYMLDQVKKNLDQRAADRSYGVSGTGLTPALGWSLPELRKTWNQVKNDAAPWWPDNSKEAYNSGLDALARALGNWRSSRTGTRAGAIVGFPRFKAKHRSTRSVRFTTGALRVEADRHHLILPRLGRVCTHESTRKLARRLDNGTARILSATVSCRAGRWYCALQVVVAGKSRPAHAGRSRHSLVGVDVGVKDLLVVATPDGVEVDRIAAPKPLAAAQARLRALQRRAARQRGPYEQTTGIWREPSMRWRRTAARIDKVHARAADIRTHELHVATTALATRHQVVVVEQLNVKGLGRRGGTYKRGLNRALADAALGRTHAYLTYKTKWYGTSLVTAPRFFPSTQLCSRCGAKNKLRLRDRVYHCCTGCPPIDRDLNAAINLARLGETTNAGGRTGTGTGSSPAASTMAGNGRRANQKTNPAATTAGLAGGDETSTPHTVKTGTATPQGEAA